MGDSLDEVVKYFRDAILGGSGGLVAYLYHYAKLRQKDPKAKMDVVAFLINGIVGAFMAYCFGGLVPETLEYRDGVVGIIGVVGFGLMGAIESRFVEHIMSKVMK